jgi:hypothetical protein
MKINRPTQSPDTLFGGAVLGGGKIGHISWQSLLLSLLVQLTKYNEAYQYEVSDCFPQLFIILLHSPFENGVVGLLSTFHPQRQREKWY